MGTFVYRIEIGATEEGPFAPVEAVVDTGAAYTWIPREVLARLGVAPRGTRRFLLADGCTIVPVSYLNLLGTGVFRAASDRDLGGGESHDRLSSETSNSIELPSK